MGPSILYQGPFVVAEDPKRQPAKVFLPIQYDSKPTWPLVVLLHGFTGTADAENLYLGLAARTSLRGFILVTPNGTLTPKGTLGQEARDLSDLPFWNATDACCDFGKTQVDDVGYITRVINEVKSQYRVDSKRIYIFGHSNGAFMANRMACEIGEQLGGVASLAGGTFADSSKCRTPVAVPYLQIHGVDDSTIKYEETKEYAGARATVSDWLKRNSCTTAPARGRNEDYVVLIPSTDTTAQNWKCNSGKPVSLWTIKAFTSKYHNAHIPLFHLNFTDRVLDFLFASQR
jgi:polyhydroxybutyrate depolymerase